MTIAESKHEPDNRFLECTRAARADHLFTGNTKHFPSRHKTTAILNARQLLDLLPFTLTSSQP